MHGQCPRVQNNDFIVDCGIHLFAVMICQTQANQLEPNSGTDHFPGKWDNMSRTFQSFLRSEPIGTISPGKRGMERLVGFRYRVLFGAWAHVKSIT